MVSIMEAKPLRFVVVIVAAVAGSIGARSAIEWARREPGVAASVLTQPWSEVAPGGKDVVFDAPLVPKPTTLDLPADVRAQTRQVITGSVEDKGLNVLTMYMQLAPGRVGNLEGAADGALSNIKNIPGTSVASSHKTNTTIAGLPAIEIEATVQRGKSDEIKLHGLVLGRGEELFQVLVAHRLDQPRGDEVWQRMRGTVRVKGR